MARAPDRYRVYGLTVVSDLPLPCPEAGDGEPPEVELRLGPAAFFREASGALAGGDCGDDWFRHRRLADGSDYLRWSDLFEFLVSADGRRIACRPLARASAEAFQTYLLGQVLSFGLVKLGVEPLHATAAVIHGGAVGLLGECGYGKSSLGAAFLAAGDPLLTDDLLVAEPDGQGFVAHPGPPRIKLFPEVAARFLGERAAGTPMNDLTPKLVIPIDGGDPLFCDRPVPLRAIYVLGPPAPGGPGQRVRIRRVSGRRAVIELLRGTFNTVVAEPARLARQLDLAARLAGAVPVSILAFPRALTRLPEVREAIRSDLAA